MDGPKGGVYKDATGDGWHNAHGEKIEPAEARTRIREHREKARQKEQDERDRLAGGDEFDDDDFADKIGELDPGLRGATGNSPDERTASSGATSENGGSGTGSPELVRDVPAAEGARSAADLSQGTPRRQNDGSAPGTGSAAPAGDDPALTQQNAQTGTQAAPSTSQSTAPKTNAQAKKS